MSGIQAHRWFQIALVAAVMAGPAAAVAQGVVQETTPADPAQVETVGAPALPEGQYLYVAGVAPSVRPAGAPVITEFVKTPEWYAQALSGVSQPYPESLKFLEDVGGWWAPFIHPGMTGPYDIRGWHAAN